jgi:Zn-finger nucleic acid-binding protein
MKCPVCRTETFQPCQLSNGLDAHQCQKCSGIWIASLNYFAWLRQLNKPFPDIAPGAETFPAWDIAQAKICPDCGHLLTRYKIWPNIEFFLDHCGSCNGIWFDCDEWQVIETHNLHDDLNQVFTKPWQRKIKEDEGRQVLEKVYLERFGADDYARVREIRAWIQSHPQSAMLLAYLYAKDPYQF